MFGNDSSVDEIYEIVLDGMVEERLNLITDESYREAVSNFLKFDPKDRWSADDALHHPMFQSDTCTTTSQI